MKLNLPDDITILPTAGTVMSMAYKVLYKNRDVGFIERAPMDEGGAWVLTGRGRFWGYRFESEEFDDVVQHVVALALRP